VRIAMISEHASPLAALGSEDAGGQNTHVAEVSSALANLGHQVRVYTRRDAASLPEAVELREGVQVVHVPAGPPEPVPKNELLSFMPEFAGWLAGNWRHEWLPDVAHAHFWMSGLAALSAGRRVDIPVVQTYHALGTVRKRHQGSRDSSPSQRIESERMLGRQVDRVIAQCRDEVRELVRLGVPRSRIVVVPSGVNERRFTPGGPAVPRRTGRARILTVGRLVERKGFLDIVAAMRAVPEVDCVVVGGPPGTALAGDPLAVRLRALADAYGHADRLHLVGAVPPEEMPAWYRSADVVVAAPWYEPFGLTPLEAMACGVPVIGTAVGGLLDTVVDGVTGDLVPPRHPVVLGTVLGDLLRDPVRRLGYSAAAVDRVRGRYSWRRAAMSLSAVYASVVRSSTEAVA
jgi:D-inositol-3-phosphate glycosyltransferase